MNSIVQLSEELEKVDEKLKTTSVLLDKKVGCSFASIRVTQWILFSFPLAKSSDDILYCKHDEFLYC